MIDYQTTLSSTGDPYSAQIAHTRVLIKRINHKILLENNTWKTHFPKMKLQWMFFEVSYDTLSYNYFQKALLQFHFRKILLPIKKYICTIKILSNKLPLFQSMYWAFINTNNTHQHFFFSATLIQSFIVLNSFICNTEMFCKTLEFKVFLNMYYGSKGNKNCTNATV